jgi:hypothetical protein
MVLATGAFGSNVAGVGAGASATRHIFETFPW